MYDTYKRLNYSLTLSLDYKSETKHMTRDYFTSS